MLFRGLKPLNSSFQIQGVIAADNSNAREEFERGPPAFCILQPLLQNFTKH